MNKINLNASQQKIIAAMYELLPAGFVHRRDINRVIIGRGASYGLALKRMISLQQIGLVEPELEEAVQLVKDKICTCSCDRWRLTAGGRQVARGIKVALSKESELAARCCIARNTDDYE